MKFADLIEKTLGEYKNDIPAGISGRVRYNPKQYNIRVDLGDDRWLLDLNYEENYIKIARNKVVDEQYYSVEDEDLEKFWGRATSEFRQRLIQDGATQETLRDYDKATGDLLRDAKVVWKMKYADRLKRQEKPQVEKEA